MEKKLKTRSQFTHWKTTSEKAVIKSIVKLNPESWNELLDHCLYFDTHFVRNFRGNMVAAIDWCSHTTHKWIWLVSCFGFNGPLRQYFSLYRAVFQRGRKKREKIDERENVPHLLQAQ